MKQAYKYTAAVIILTGFSYVYSPVNSAENTRPVFYNLNFHGGTGLPHHPTQVYFNKEYIKSIELNAWFYGSNQSGINNSILGAGYLFSNLGNKNIYGNVHSLYMNMLNPLVSGRLPVQIKTGLGIAYVTKKFDTETNNFNRAMGSHLNAYGHIAISGRIPFVEDRLIFRPGITFHHVSSGAITMPNQGLNMLTINAGIEFSSGHSHSGFFVLKRDKLHLLKNRFSVIYAPGIKQVDWRLDKQIFTSSLILDYGYNFRPERSIGAGISLFYNDTWAYLPYTRPAKDDSLSPFQSAVHISLQIDRGPVAFILHPGIYIYMPAIDRPYLTNRLGMKYSLANNITFQFSIKAHWFAIADYFEWGIGYEFYK
jgi:hypothetical protein